jgi:hypothetical protein
MLMVGRLIVDDPQFIRCDSQITLGTPDWLFGMHSNLPVLLHVIFFMDGFLSSNAACRV